MATAVFFVTRPMSGMGSGILSWSGCCLAADSVCVHPRYPPLLHVQPQDGPCGWLSLAARTGPRCAKPALNNLAQKPAPLPAHACSACSLLEAEHQIHACSCTSAHALIPRVWFAGLSGLTQRDDGSLAAEGTGCSECAGEPPLWPSWCSEVALCCGRVRWLRCGHCKWSLGIELPYGWACLRPYAKQSLPKVMQGGSPQSAGAVARVALQGCTHHLRQACLLARLQGVYAEAVSLRVL